MRKSTGKDKIVAWIAGKIIESQQKSRARKISLLGSQFVYMGVLSDDFADVDVREELCYHSLPKKAKFGGAAKNRQQRYL